MSRLTGNEYAWLGGVRWRGKKKGSFLIEKVRHDGHSLLCARVFMQQIGASLLSLSLASQNSKWAQQHRRARMDAEKKKGKRKNQCITPCMLLDLKPTNASFFEANVSFFRTKVSFADKRSTQRS